VISTHRSSGPHRSPRPRTTPSVGLVVAAALVALVACGGKAAPARGGDGPLVQRFPALRWVPAEATMVATSTSVEAGVTAARTLVAVAGMAAGVTVAEVEQDLARMGLPNLLSPTELGQLGVDLRAGVAAFAQGVSPTLVFRLADPALMQAHVDRAVKSGAKIASVNLGGVEVHRELGRRPMLLHWAMADGWMWVHFELRDGQRELLDEPADAWFTASRSAGGVAAADPDLSWALESTTARAGQGPALPVLVMVRAEALLSRVVAKAMSKREQGELAPCLALAPRRVAIALGAGDDAASGVMIVDGGGAIGLLAGAARPHLAGWAGARDGATVALDVGVGLASLAGAVPPCLGVERDAVPAETVHAFVHDLDLGSLKGKGAMDLGLSGPALRGQLEAGLDQIPGRSAFERDRSFGPLKGKNLSVPMFGEFDYVLTDDRMMLAMGAGLLTRAVGTGATEPGPLLRLELRPTQWPRQTWDQLLGMVVQRDGTRGQILDELLRWSLGLVEASVDGDLLVVRARGTRAGVAPIAR
jgi:hypothetical protein